MRTWKVERVGTAMRVGAASLLVLFAAACGGSGADAIRIVTPKDLVDLERGALVREALTGPQLPGGAIAGRGSARVEIVDPLAADPGGDLGAFPDGLLPGEERSDEIVSTGSTGSAGGSDVGGAAEPTTGAATGRRAAAALAAAPRPMEAPAREWVIDGLVGQVNGRPIFADAFLDQISDRLRQASREMSRPEARQLIILLVSERFEQWVNNELVIAEAESLLTPEQQQGLFAFLRDIQEGEVLRRGGTRSSAEASLLDDFGYNIEEYMARTRNEILAADLLRRRIAPRAIVTWRDMEREFDRRSALYAPGSTIEVGRMALVTRRDGERIQRASAAFAQGRGFLEVAAELEVVGGGRWREFVLGEEGIDALAEVLVEEVVDQLRELPLGAPTQPIVQGNSTVWYSVLAIERPPARSIFDRDVQLELRAELQSLRNAEEQNRFISNLRRRWVAENIDEMRVRLVDIALRRYLR